MIDPRVIGVKQAQLEYGQELHAMDAGLTDREREILGTLLETGVMCRDAARTFGMLSRVEKMPELSYNLPRLETCPGAFDYNSSGTAAMLCQVCEKCYGGKGHYRMAHVKAKTQERMKDWPKPGWVHKMTIALMARRWHRWHDVGDICCPEYALKLTTVCKQTPLTQHWIPTKSWRVDWALPYLEALQAMDNVVVRYSGTTFVKGRVKEFGPDVIGSVVLKSRQPTTFDLLAEQRGEYLICPAHRQNGKCGPCRACWCDEYRMIAYPFH